MVICLHSSTSSNNTHTHCSSGSFVAKTVSSRVGGWKPRVNSVEFSSVGYSLGCCHLFFWDLFPRHLAERTKCIRFCAAGILL